ncbi:MAG: VOC family protein [Candidatus Kapaibacterium sp.]
MHKNHTYICLWFDNNAMEVVEHYKRAFDDLKVTDENNIVVNIKTAGQKIMLLNGGPMFKQNPSSSIMVTCETIEEADNIYNILSEGGDIIMPLDEYDWSKRFCWINDKYGVSWQIYHGKIENTGGKKFSPTFMFTGDVCGRAEEAINYYNEVFRDSDIVGILRYDNDENEMPNYVKHSQMQVNGLTMMFADSSQMHTDGFNEAFSIAVECRNQEEIDYYWQALTNGGRESMCGWLKDKFGISWQIIPQELGEWMRDPVLAPKVSKAFMQMKKFVIADILKAIG